MVPNWSPRTSSTSRTATSSDGDSLHDARRAWFPPSMNPSAIPSVLAMAHGSWMFQFRRYVEDKGIGNAFVLLETR